MYGGVGSLLWYFDLIYTVYAFSYGFILTISTRSKDDVSERESINRDKAS